MTGADADRWTLTAVFPQTEIGDDPAAIRAWAQGVEGLGYAGIGSAEHVLGAGTANRPDWRGPYTAEHAFHEIFVLYGFLAAVTTSVELSTAVLVLPQRQTALVAKQAAEVDVLSGGRLRLGVGVGWNRVEFEALDEDFGNRGARCAEQIEVLRALWSAPSVTVSGRWHRIDDAGLRPLPVRRIPIWLGGGAEATLRRVARLADGWYPQVPPEKAGPMLERLGGYLADAGRSMDEIGLEPRLAPARVHERLWAGFAGAWWALGARHLGVITTGLGHGTVDDHLATLARVRSTLAGTESSEDGR